MSIQITKKDITEITVGASKLGVAKTRIPILEHVLINEQDCTATLSNIEEFLTIRLDTEVPENAQNYTVSIDTLKTFKKNLKAKDVFEIEKNSDNSVQFRVNGTKIQKSETLNIEEFPVIRDVKNNEIATVDAQYLLKKIKYISEYASDDELRRIHENIYFNKEKQQMAATDGKRLAVYAYPVHCQALLPTTKFLLQKLVKIKDAEIDFGRFEYSGDGDCTEASYICFHTDKYDYSVREPKGIYVDYERTIPDSDSAEFYAELELGDLSKETVLMLAESDRTDDGFASVILRWTEKDGVFISAKREGSDSVLVENSSIIDRNNKKLAEIILNADHLVSIFEAGISRIMIGWNEYSGNISWIPVKAEREDLVIITMSCR